MAAQSRLDAASAKLLRSHPVFSGVDAGVFAELTAHATNTAYNKNQIIFSAGALAEHFFVVAEGTVRVFRLEDDGSEATVNIFGPGQSFGEAAMFLERQFPVTAQAIEPSKLVCVEASHVVEKIKSDPSLALGLLASMSSHLKTLVDEITLLRVPTATRRVAEFLLRSVDTTSGPATVEFEYSKVVLADRLDIAPEVLSRAFAELRASGVQVDRKHVTITDVKILQRLVRP